MKNHGYKSHIFALTALFVMGNTIVTLPFCSVKNPFLVYLLCALITILFVAVLIPIINFAFAKAGGIFKIIVFYAVGLSVAAVAVYGAATDLYDYIKFIIKIQLPQTNAVLICFGAAVIILAFALCSSSAIYKYCLLVAVVSITAVIILFLSGLKAFDITQVNLSAEWNKDVLKSVTDCLLRYSLPLAVSVAFVSLTKQKAHMQNIISGSFTGIVAIGLCLAQSVFTLGDASAYIEYPYDAAVGVISSGSLFTRLDGLAYFIFFAAFVVKAGICVKTFCLIFKSFICKKSAENNYDEVP